MNQKEYEKRVKWSNNWQKKQRESQLKYAKKKKPMKKKKKRKKKSPRAKLVDKIDDLWSLEVRKNCKCEFTGKEGNMKCFDAHHIKVRGKMSTRWYLPNGACLTKGVHRFQVHMDTFTAGRLIDRLKKERGQDWWDKLIEREKKKVKLYIQDLRDIKELANQGDWDKINKIIENNYI